MFEARLVEGRIFKQIIDAIKDLVTDTNIDCTADEMAIQCMDSAHVSLVAVQLQSGAFERYRCDRAVSLGFSTANMSKILKMMGNDDILDMKAEDDSPENITMMFENEKSDSIADFELKLMDIDAEQLTIPDTPYLCTVKMPSGEFQRIVRDLQVMGDSCMISVTKEGIRFSVNGNMGSGSVLLKQGGGATKEDEEGVVVDMKEPVELNFALRYLNMFSKATPLSKSVVISMSPDIPVRIEYQIEDTGYVAYFLAPKIDEDEEE